jgi:hypothetical protein
MTEAEARALLRDCGGFGGLEAWIAGRRWKVAPGGWAVTDELQGWQFRLAVIPAGLRISASALCVLAICGASPRPSRTALLEAPIHAGLGSPLAGGLAGAVAARGRKAA